MDIDRVAGLIVWATVANCAAFFMQRLRYENPSVRGSVIDGPGIMSFSANIIAWSLTAVMAVVAYRVGWKEALAGVGALFLAPPVISTVQQFLWPMSTLRLSIIATPIGLGAFVMALIRTVTL